MGFERLAVQTSGGDQLTYTNLDAGEYEARLIYVADLGLQNRQPFKGEEKKPCQQITLCFEVLGSTVEINGEVKPRTLWMNPTNIFSSMGSMGNELPLYRAFVPSAKEDSVPNWEEQLGKPVTLNITHNVSNGRTFDKIASVAAIPMKYQDKVAQAITTDFSVGGCEELDSPAIQNLRGFLKTNHENRITKGGSSVVAQPVSEHEEFEMNGSVPF
mgnify:FL=1